MRNSIAIFDNEINFQEDEVLILPDTPEVHRIVDEGANAVTFLHIALGILTQVEQELEDRTDEIRFVRDCLYAGPAKTQLPCNLVNRASLTDPTRCQIRRVWTSSAGRSEDSRKGVGQTTSATCQSLSRRSEISAFSLRGRLPEVEWRTDKLRGAMRALRSLDVSEVQEQPQNGHNQPKVVSDSLPWMGPKVPRWPVKELDQCAEEQLERMLQSDFNTWNFDIFNFARLTQGRPLQFVSWEALRRGGCFSEFPLEPDKLCHFLAAVESQYVTEEFTAYHNQIHASDVTQSAHSLLDDLGASAFCDPMDMMGILFAATIHDMGHDGKNNAFHISSQDHIALTYNDRSVLENYHVSEAFKLISQHSGTNFLEGLAKEQLRTLRKEVISMVLGTDMASHFSEVGNFNKICEQCGNEPGLWHEDEASMDVFRCMVLHAADISNPAKTFFLASQWSERCLKEFFVQGDAEKKLGLPVSPMCDRATTNVPGSQLGFIDFIVQPTFTAWIVLLPRVREVAFTGILLNRELWKRRQDELEQEAAITELEEHSAADGRGPALQRRTEPLKAKPAHPSRPLYTL